MTETEIYRRALELISRCNEATCERYVAKVDGIVCEALALGDSILSEDVDQRVIGNDEVTRPLPRAA